MRFSQGFRLRRRVFTATLGLLALLLPAPLLGQDVHGVRAVQASAEVLADTEGAISEVTFQYNFDTRYEIEPVFWDMFSKLPGDIRVIVLCASTEAVDDFVETWGAIASTNGREVEVVNVGRDISVWARDRRIARSYTGRGVPAPSLVPSPFPDYENWRYNELHLPFLLQPIGLVPGVQTTDLSIEGGNVVANRAFVFVGANAVFENENLDWSADAVENELQHMLGHRLMILGTFEGDVPWCHTDMYVTPVDERVILVASPTLGMELLGTDAWDAECDDNDMLASVDDASLVQDTFDHVVDQLKRRGFTVIRLPAMVSVTDGWMVTYNNVLMDHRDGKRVVYMPTYDVPALDRAARAIYRGLGFEVRTVDVSRLYTSGGAVRCVSNVTRRGPAFSRTDFRARRKRGTLRVLDVSDCHIEAEGAAASDMGDVARNPDLQAPQTIR